MGVENKIGPHSKDEAFLTADGRTKTARMLKEFRLGLTDHVGEPTFAEALVIRQAAIKATRLVLGEQKAIDEAETDSDGHHWLSWSESLRRDLQLLGLGPRENAPIDLATYIRQQDQEAGK